MAIKHMRVVEHGNGTFTLEDRVLSIFGLFDVWSGAGYSSIYQDLRSAEHAMDRQIQFEQERAIRKKPRTHRSYTV